jgi:hypothetical protein
MPARPLHYFIRTADPLRELMFPEHADPAAFAWMPSSRCQGRILPMSAYLPYLLIAVGVLVVVLVAIYWRMSYVESD